MVEKGDFIDPSEATFVFLDQAQDIDDNVDIKRQILQRRLEQRLEDDEDDENENTSSGEDVFKRLIEELDHKHDTAVWKKISQP